MTRQLTSRSTLDNLRKEAKRWLKALRAGDPEARRRLEAVFPWIPARPGLRDVQQALAREHGLSGWAALATALDDLAIAGRSHADRQEDFLDLSCLHYGVRPGERVFSDHADSPDRRRQAARILERYPEVGKGSLHAAVVCGDLGEVERILASRPEAASEKGGREGWDPLLFLCYGRLPVAAASDNAVTIATMLLDHRADPNSHWSYQWEDRLMTWSALCGVIGHGENGPQALPPHPRADDLARLLLDRGADPNQSQAMYNTMVRGDDEHWLRVLIDRGLSAQDPILWEGPGSKERLFDYLLVHAVANNQLRRAAVLLEHGADANHLDEQRSLYQSALMAGNAQMAELLVRYGAQRGELGGVEAFRAACMGLHAEEARRLLAAHPEYLADASSLMVEQVASRDLVEVARLLLDLGVSPDAEHVGPGGAYRALHGAACTNSIGVARLLLDRGADVDARDASEHATPLGWAVHTQMPGTLELFARHTRDPFTLTAAGQGERLRALLTEDPALANLTLTTSIGLGVLSGEPGETPLFVLPDDEGSALEMAELLLALGADRHRRNQAGQTPAEKARSRGLGEVFEMLAPE